MKQIIPIAVIVGWFLFVIFVLPIPHRRAAAQAERPEPPQNRGSVTRIYGAYTDNIWTGVYHINGKCFAVWQQAAAMTSQPVPCPW